MRGLFDRTPKFVRRYGDVKSEIAAVRAYARDVREGAFPGEAETCFAKVKAAV